MYKSAARFRCPSSRISIGGIASGKKTDKIGTGKCKKAKNKNNTKIKSKKNTKKQIVSKLINKIGSKVDGVVNKIVEYGAFVDIGGINGLIYYSDLSIKYGRVSDVLKIGQKVSPVILEINKVMNGKYRINLSLKNIIAPVNK